MRVALHSTHGPKEERRRRKKKKGKEKKIEVANFFTFVVCV